MERWKEAHNLKIDELNEGGWPFDEVRGGHTGVVITNRVFIGRIGDLGREHNSHNNTYPSAPFLTPGVG